MTRASAAIVGLLLFTACNDEVKPEEPTGFGYARADAGGRDAASGQGDAGFDSPPGCIARPRFDAPLGYPTFAVHSSDYSSSAVALLDETGAVLDARYLSSASTIEGLSGGLHGDISLPTSPGRADVLTVVARFMGDYVLRVDLGDGSVLDQTRTQAIPFDADDPGAAYASNPQDYLHVDAHTAIVTRYGRNLDPGAAAIDRGDDLLVIDPATSERLQHIALDDWVETASVDDGAGGSVEELVHARPAQIVGLGCHAVFGTARLSENWHGHPIGAVGVLDLVNLDVEKIELETLRNCGDVVPVTGDPERAIVLCSGSPWLDRATAGLVMLHVDAAGTATVEHSYVSADADADAPILSGGLVSLGGTRMVVGETGDQSTGAGDVLYLFDIATGEYEKLLTTPDTDELGSGAYDPSRGVLYVPVADLGLVTFDVSDSAVTERDTLVIDRVLPVRQIRPLRVLPSP